jgi:hypothetical protein
MKWASPMSLSSLKDEYFRDKPLNCSPGCIVIVPLDLGWAYLIIDIVAMYRCVRHPRWNLKQIFGEMKIKS